LLWSPDPGSSVVFLLLPILIIPFIIGLLDDLFHLKPNAKLLAQWVTASLIFAILQIRITSFYDFLPDYEFSTVLSYCVTAFVVVVITNSLNLIDGIDGLAAAFSVIACLFFGSWFLMAEQYSFALICLSLAGGILAFLFQNWEPSNIFMGDTGSLVIGTLLSIITIQFVNSNHTLSPTDPIKFNSSILAALCAMIIPLVDTTRIIIVRLSLGISPFTADQRHIHHGLVKLGFTHKRAVYILALVHIAMITMAILLRHGNQFLLLALVVGICLTLCLLLRRALIRMER
jgi:UDP-GlcNAc:undecaprenyl-phosphate GlcNAc-1-phosphate transferase